MSRVKVNEITNKVATGPVDFPDGITGVALTVTGNVTVGGTIISEDTTNVDSVGFITARAGLNVGPPATGIGATIHSNGNAVFAGITTVATDIHVGENIAHLGDTDTKIVFTDNQLDLQTGGYSRAHVNNYGFYIRSGFGLSFLASSGDSPHIKSGGTNNQDLLFTTGTSNPTRLQIAADGKIGIGTDIPAVEFHVYDNDSLLVSIFESVTHDSRLRIKAPSTKYSQIEFADGDADTGEIRYDHTDDSMQFLVNANVERLRITSTGGVNFSNGELIENANVTAGKLSDNQTINLDNGMVHLFTTTETTTATPNIMSTAGINTSMSNGDAITVTLITTAAAGAYCANIQIDGAAVTENWIGGSAPSDGGSSGVDVHTFSIIKTASATFTVLGNQSKTS